MAASDSSFPPAPAITVQKEDLRPISSRIAELNESKTELLYRMQSLKQDVQNWRSKFDTQVTLYRNELTELKKSLSVEVEQLHSEFQNLRTTLQQQQNDVAASLKNLGLQDPSRSPPVSQNQELENNDEIDSRRDGEDKPNVTEV